MIENNFFATLACALISGLGAGVYSYKWGKESLETAIWKGGMTALCTAVSVNSIIGVKTDIPTVVNKISTAIFGVGNGSYMEEKRDDYGLVYKGMPPYEVLYTKWLPYLRSVHQ